MGDQLADGAASGSGGEQPATTPALEVRALSKSFGPVKALREVTFSLQSGEVLGLLGDNGAGKSTLVRCVAGVHSPDRGEMLINGRVVEGTSSKQSRGRGVETVHQDLALMPNLDIAANLFAGRELYRGGRVGRALGLLNRHRMYVEALEHLDRLHIDLPPPESSVADLSGGQRQAIAVGRAVAFGREIVLLDEPTAALGVEQTALVLSLIKRLRHEGVAVLLVSHNMYDVLEVCDRAVVLRHGAKIHDVPTLEGLTARDLVDLISGAGLGTDSRHEEEPAR